MRWAALALPVLLIAIMLPMGSDGASGVKATLDGSEFIVSVDPSDPYQGVLEVSGKVQPSIVDVRDKITVTLSSNITEMDDNGRTGRYWHSTAAFDGAAQSPTRIFKKGDPPATFTVVLDPSKCDPQTTRDIPVPTGLSLLTWGKLVLTAKYSGSAEGTSTDDAKIVPGPFYLINLTLNSRTHNISAGDVLNLTFNVKNPSNQEEGVSIRIPVLEELEGLGWNVTTTGIEVPLLVPGESRDIGVRLVAPEEIEYTETFTFEVTAHTLETDPDTSDPESTATSSFELRAIESKVDDGGGGPDINDTDGKGSGPTSGEVLAGIAVLTLVVVSLIILVMVLLRGRGGGKDGTRDGSAHSPPVRM